MINRPIQFVIVVQIDTQSLTRSTTPIMPAVINDLCMSSMYVLIAVKDHNPALRHIIDLEPNLAPFDAGKDLSVLNVHMILIYACLCTGIPAQH